jgi:hypothetical protein
MLPADCPAKTINPLWLTLSPAFSDAAGSDCGHGGAVPVAKRGRGKGRRPEHESEHRAVPVRTYWLNTIDVSPDITAYVVHPDTVVEEIAINREEMPKISFTLPFGDGPVHGGNFVYVIDRKVVDGVLTVRTAKWLTIHHSCGWGHNHRFEEERLRSQRLPSAPLDIVINGLWDGNFHSTIMAGDTLDIRVLLRGEPAKNVRVSVTTEKKWTNEVSTGPDGIASVQLVRDDYPDNWLAFKRDKKSSFKVVARHAVERKGIYQNQSYETVRYITTFPWRYYPSRSEYSSYSSGLLVGTLSFGVGGVGIYAYRERRKKPFKGTVFDE